ncbi:tenomodulin-like [Megalops cyprinoides]|uniref:tenomodulin-like n=1 Tax=Megalops cyprinoides TaxID=118141 RepID=UPI0018644B8D|nr:tenomodulin-like [Megalops cyprinoides]
METNCQSSSQEALWRDVEVGTEKKNRFRSYQLGAIVLSLVLLSLTLCVFSMKQFWTPSPTKVYDLHYKVVLDGAEMDSVMEIDPAHRIEIFRMGNDTDEVLEIHDFKNGMTGIRFSKQQRCYIRSQTKELPTLSMMEPQDAEMLVEAPDAKVNEPQVWIPSAEPIASRAFLLNSKISEICQHLPIHWIHPSPLIEAEFHDIEDLEEPPKVRGQRQVRDVLDHQPVNDYRDVGLELDNRLDDRGYCCQHCRQGYRYCRRYHEPLGGFWPYPYYYQGGRVICQIVMPCNWWIARMLGRV